MKAYSSCVGEGPFTCEFFGDEAHALREAGGEYGAATGRPRRVGGFDVVASRYGVMMQGATEIALTKLDVLSYLDKVPVCVAYEVDGERITDFPTGQRLERAKPVYEYLPGFGDVSKCRKKRTCPRPLWITSRTWKKRSTAPSNMFPSARNGTLILRCFNRNPRTLRSGDSSHISALFCAFNLSISSCSWAAV